MRKSLRRMTMIMTMIPVKIKKPDKLGHASKIHWESNKSGDKTLGTSLDS